jgi:hypothetical protein
VTLDPFEDNVVTFKIAGLRLKELLKKHRPAVSGLRYRLENGELAEATVKGEPLKDDRIYTGSSNSYFGRYALTEVQDTGKKRLDVLAEYIRRKGTIHPAYDGRRVVIGP